MGLYDRTYYREDEYRQGLGGSRPVFLTILIINVVIFLADTLFFGKNLTEWMRLRSSDLLQPLYWWRFLTAGFLHDPNDIWHLAGNMIALFFFGRDVEMTYGRKKFISFYLTAILLGNLGFAIRHLAMGIPASVVGASGAITAIIILFALNFPKRTILFMMVIPMPAWVLGIIIIFADLARSFNAVDSNVASDVHLIGAGYGYLFFRTGWEITFWKISNIASFKMPKRRPKVRLYDPGSRSQKLDEQADRILEKLHQQGQDSLTAKERKILEDYSRRLRQKK